MEANHIEAAIDGVAAAALGMAIAFSATLMGAGVAGAAAGAAGFGLGFAGLRSIPSAARWRIADFALVSPVDEDAAGELVLTDADRVGPEHFGRAALAIADELQRQPPTVIPAADLRVVQLFGDRPLPTAGELQASIDRHLEGRQGPPAAPDAAAALSEALAELRRSLR